MRIIHQKTKTLITRDNGRSADAIAPNLIYGCWGGCMQSYCYVSRYNNDRVYINENTDQILQSVDTWIENQVWPKVPNQTDPIYYTVDIGCSTDVALMSKYYDWQRIFDYFNTHPKAKSTFATKYPNRFNKNRQYNIDPEKNRIRVSLMPQVYSDILEPKTNSIKKRIDCIPVLQDQMEVHLNFSPIIYTDGWLEEYRKLFELLSDRTGGSNIPCECIFLTYNDIQYKRNSEEVNALCWAPDIQEHKNSTYAADNIRYKWQLKKQIIEQFKTLYSEFFDMNNIRYIF